MLATSISPSSSSVVFSSIEPETNLYFHDFSFFSRSALSAASKSNSSSHDQLHPLDTRRSDTYLESLLRHPDFALKLSEIVHQLDVKEFHRVDIVF